MALANALQPVQDSDIYFCPDLRAQTFLVIPGTSDYPAGGYVITAIMCNMKMVQQVIVTGCNATSIAGWQAYPIFPETELSSGGPPYTGYSSFKLYVEVIAGANIGLENSANLSGCIWQIQVSGY